MEATRRREAFIKHYPMLALLAPTAASLVAALGTSPNWGMHHHAVVAAWALSIASGLALLGAPRLAAMDRQRLSGVAAVDEMSGAAFEAWLADLFADQGYRVTLTAATGDYGADLVLERDGVRTIVQAKRYADPVGIDAVYQVVGALAHYGADAAVVVTNSSFTHAAAVLARENGVELVDRDHLVDLLANRLDDTAGDGGLTLLGRQILAGLRPAFVCTIGFAAVIVAIAVGMILAVLSREQPEAYRYPRRARGLIVDYTIATTIQRALRGRH